jgi:non-ribosomal peptide synthase protein (TIGR01720 family)
VLLRGGPAALHPSPGTSFRRWARFLERDAHSPARTAELPLWQAAVAGADAGLGCPPFEPGRPRRVLTVELPPEHTGPLLADVTTAFHCGPNEVLLTALAAAVVRWRGGPAEVLVDVEGHGRHPVPGMDTSRTVGWFTSQYPVRISLGEADPELFWRAGPDTGETLKRVKEQLRAVPDGGIGYGLLRYLNADTAADLAGGAVPQLRFNYLGRTGAGERAGTDLLGGPPEALAGHPVELDAVTEDRDDGPHLVASWSWSDGAVADDRVRDLARLWFDALTVLAEHGASAGAGGFTESDFPLVDLTRAQLDALGADWSDLP